MFSLSLASHGESSVNGPLSRNRKITGLVYKTSTLSRSDASVEVARSNENHVDAIDSLPSPREMLSVLEVSIIRRIR